MPTTDELDARLAALESRLAATPLAANPPITVGELVDVPAPGSAIASAWAQEVSNRIVHRFATIAARDAWAAANGSLCFTTEGTQLWRRAAGAWVPVSEVFGNIPGPSFGSAVAATIVQSVLPVIAVAHTLSATFHGVCFMTGGTGGQIDLKLDATVLASWKLPTVANNVMCSLNVFGIPLAAGAAGTLAVVWTPSGGTSLSLFSDPTANRLSWMLSM
jgi:hypothetical protein